MTSSQDQLLLEKAAKELETLRKATKHDGLSFPRHCRRLLHQIPGNNRCIDCDNSNPEWASVTYGVLLCVNCSGRHRSYGVKTSRVRSIAMDAWSHSQVLSLLEGGNQQMKQFFHRHQMQGENISALDQQYRTKAAHFYRTHLGQHVDKVANAGLYPGRKASRNTATKRHTQRAPTKTVQDCRSTIRYRACSRAIAVR